MSVLGENDTWPGNSRDLNVAERTGTVIKNEVEQKMLSETGHNRYVEERFKKHLSYVLTKMILSTELFEILLCSYPISMLFTEKKIVES